MMSSQVKAQLESFDRMRQWLSVSKTSQFENEDFYLINFLFILRKHGISRIWLWIAEDLC